MGNWLKGRVLINDASLITDNAQQTNQVVGPPSNYQVSLKILDKLLSFMIISLIKSWMTALKIGTSN